MRTFSGLVAGKNFELERLYLRNNSLTMDVSSNKIGRWIPAQLGIVFPSMSKLDLSANAFEGRIPFRLVDMKLLNVLDLLNNNSSGTLPVQLINGSSSLGTLSLADNNLQGEIIFPNVFAATGLRSLRLDHNKFYGEIPSCHLL